MSLKDVARELELPDFEKIDVSEDGLETVEKLVYSLNYSNPLDVASALTRMLKYVTHNMTAQDILHMTLQVPRIVPYYSEKYRLPLEGMYTEADGYLVPDAPLMSKTLQEMIYAGGEAATEKQT